MSAVEAAHTVVGALAAIETHIGASPEWRATTESQAAFIRDVYTVCRPEVDRIPEIESCGVTLARRLTDDSAACARFAGVVFPMVDFQVKCDLDVVVGLVTQAADGRSVAIMAAEQHSSPTMNERGARAEAVVILSLSMGVQRQPPRDFVIREPFLLWCSGRVFRRRCSSHTSRARPGAILETWLHGSRGRAPHDAPGVTSHVIAGRRDL